MKLAALFLLVQPCIAQLSIFNAASDSENNFAAGSLVLASVAPLTDLSNATLTLSPSTPVPVVSVLDSFWLVARLPAGLPLGQTSIFATVKGMSTPPTAIKIVPTNFGMFRGPIQPFPVICATLNCQPPNLGLHVVQKNNGPLVALTLPAHAGDYLSIYGTGLGSATANQVSVSLAGLSVPVTYAGPAPGEPGVDQINVLIPSNLEAPDSCSDTLTVSVLGISSNLPLPYTKTAAFCPSAFGLNPSELAAIDAGSPVSFVQLQTSSDAGPSPSGSGFTRLDSASAYEQNYTFYLEPNNVVDSVLYSCSNSTATLGGEFALQLPLPFSGLTLTTASTSIPLSFFGYSNETTAPTVDALAASIFAPGTWHIYEPGFSASIAVPPTIEIQNLSSLQSIDSTRDLRIVWNPSGYASTDVASVAIYASTSFASVSCRAPAAAGSVVIPASFLSLALDTLIATVSPHTDQTSTFRLPQPDGSTLPLQFSYSFSETVPVALH